jgi:hypothetical protein
MIELAEIFRQYGPAYRAKFGDRMPAGHLKAMKAIEECRTEALGGHVYECDDCGEVRYSYHSCKNRHCPKCQNEAGQAWLARQQAMLLPVPCFMVTFTLPEGLRELARREQRQVYNLLFRASAAALQTLANDPRFVGGQIGFMGVLQTWTRDQLYHPHVHYLVPGGGLSADGQSWMRTRRNFLVHVKPLSRLFRSKFREGLKSLNLLEQVPARVWSQEWVVHCEAVGSGEAALKYLAPYIFRVAISNNRILKLENGQVTFRYQESETRRWKTRTVSAEEFIRRFLQHVLPQGFQKVRYYGFFAPSQRHRLAQVHRLLKVDSQPPPETPPVEDQPKAPSSPANPPVILCPGCGKPMRHVRVLLPHQCHSP